MSNVFLNQVTIECLMNKDQYEKHVKQQIRNKVSKNEKNFYRKRILSLTKDLLYPNNPNILNEHAPFPDIKYALDNYINNCIQYFKAIDNSDIIQEEFKDSHEEKIFAELGEEEDDLVTYTQENANKLMMRTVKMDNALDKFVIRTPSKANKQNTIVLPKQKEINLKDPSLKNKGIRKKKNINNNYETDEKNKKNKNENENENQNEKTKYP